MRHFVPELSRVQWDSSEHRTLEAEDYNDFQIRRESVHGSVLFIGPPWWWRKRGLVVAADSGISTKWRPLGKYYRVGSPFFKRPSPFESILFPGLKYKGGKEGPFHKTAGGLADLWAGDLVWRRETLLARSVMFIKLHFPLPQLPDNQQNVTQNHADIILFKSS